MDITNEFLRVRAGFIKVKNDVLGMKQDMNELYDKKANKDEVQFLINEIGKLKKEMKQVLETGKFVRLVGNLDSKKVHYSNCPYAKKITNEHKIIFDSVEESKKHQFVPCSCVEH